MFIFLWFFDMGDLKMLLQFLRIGVKMLAVADMEEWVKYIQRVLCVQRGTKEPEWLAFHDMILRYFDLLRIHLKLMPGPWDFSSKQIWTIFFKWGTVGSFRLTGCKNISVQSWWSKKKLPSRQDSTPMRQRPGQTSRFLFNLQLWSVIFLQPFDQNKCLVSQLEDLIHICFGPAAQDHCMFFKYTFGMSKLPSNHSVEWKYSNTSKLAYFEA